MGRRPNLKVKRPVDRQRYRWYGWSNEGYQAWLDREKVRIGRLPHETAGQSKRVTTELRYVPLGRWCRQVDGHGKCFGPRLQREADLPGAARVRIVQRQEEDLHSQLSRMMKRAHKAAMKD